MNAEEQQIREEYRRRRPKGSLYRGGPTQRSPEDVVVEMVLEERAISKSTLETYIAGASKEADDLRARIEGLRETVYRYREALERIANEDYRGNRPPMAQFAWEVLRRG